MTDEERQEFKAMVTDVAILKHSNEKIIEPTLKKINDKTEVDDKIADTRGDIEEKLMAVQKRRWYENTISATFGALLTGVAMFIVNEIIGWK